MTTESLSAQSKTVNSDHRVGKFVTRTAFAGLGLIGIAAPRALAKETISSPGNSQQDMTQLAQQISELLTDSSLNVSYTHYNSGNNTATIDVDINANVEGNPYGQYGPYGQYELSYTGPRNAVGDPDPSKITNLYIMSEEGLETSDNYYYYIVDGLSFSNDTKTPIDYGTVFDGSYKTGNTTSGLVQELAVTNPKGNVMDLNQSRLNSAFRQAEGLIATAEADQPITEMPPAFTPTPGASIGLPGGK